MSHCQNLFVETRKYLKIPNPSQWTFITMFLSQLHNYCVAAANWTCLDHYFSVEEVAEILTSDFCDLAVAFTSLLKSDTVEINNN